MRVAIIGSGGVAEAFARNIDPKVLVQITGRNKQRVSELSAMVGLPTCDDLHPADLYILAVSDDSVSAVSTSYPFVDEATIVHTAGSVSIEALRGAVDRNATLSIGVLYPLQSFTQGRAVALSDVPFFVEGDCDATLSRVRDFAATLSSRVVELSSSERRRLHLAAVFASNFTNAMFAASSDILASASLSFDLYAPLIRETIAKAVESNDPRAMQTGPAKRGDEVTMARHIEMLAENKAEKLIEIYKIISKYIWETSKRI